jgi:hypothetical protein
MLGIPRLKTPSLVAIAITAWTAAPAASQSAAPTPTAGVWQKVSDQDGIIVYEKDLEGSETISLRGEAVIDAALADVAAVMKDNTQAAEWVPFVASRRVLEAISPDERIEYTHVRMPWPIVDRYFINRGRQEPLPGGALRLFVQSVATPNPAWLEDDKVLGDLHYSEFLLFPLDGGRRTRLTLEVNTDPRGMLPKWLVNMAQRSWPRDFVTGLVGQLQKRGRLATEVAKAP